MLHGAIPSEAILVTFSHFILKFSLRIVTVFPCIKSTGLTSEQFCEELLNDQLVACVPGSAFGEAGEGYIRVSYAYSLEELKAATKKIRKFLENKEVI